MELDESEIINCVPERIFQICPIKPFWQWRTLGGTKGGASPPPPIIFTGALVLKSVSTRELSFQEVEPLLII